MQLWMVLLLWFIYIYILNGSKIDQPSNFRGRSIWAILWFIHNPSDHKSISIWIRAYLLAMAWVQSMGVPKSMGWRMSQITSSSWSTRSRIWPIPMDQSAGVTNNLGFKKLRASTSNFVDFGQCLESSKSLGKPNTSFRVRKYVFLANSNVLLVEWAESLW